LEKKSKEKTVDDKKKEGNNNTKDGKEEEKVKKAKKSHAVHKELSLLVHLKSVGFRDYDEARAKGKAWHIASFSENKVNKLLRKSAVQYVDYNSRQLSRIYPKGMRVDSSNYDPVPSWCCGAQVVALNYQTCALPMWLNDGKFHDNGRSGYLLKPKFMREEKITFDPDGKHPVQKTLILTVISGFQLPKVEGKEKKQKGEVIDPYVSIQVQGVPADRNGGKTKVVKNNGLNPIWKQEFKFPITQPELALLLFTVSDADLISSDDLIGHYVCRFSNLRQGYRSLPLRDSKGNPYEKASIFVHVKYA